MIDDLLAAIQQPIITAQDILNASELARKYLSPRYKNLLYAEREQATPPPAQPVSGDEDGNQ